MPLLARVCWIRVVIVWTVRRLRRLRMPAFVRILVVVLGLLPWTLFGVKTIISPLSVVYVGSTCDMREQLEGLSSGHKPPDDRSTKTGPIMGQLTACRANFGRVSVTRVEPFNL